VLLADWQRLAAAGPGMLALQIVFQGLGAGLVAVLAFSRAAALLGSGRAAFFAALVPGAAALLAIPVLGEVPNRPAGAGHRGGGRRPACGVWGGGDGAEAAGGVRGLVAWPPLGLRLQWRQCSG